jgi:hypothetical protein
MVSTADERSRILAIYREMPGLRLSVEQASRLFGLEREPCAHILQALVAEGVLRPLDGYYIARGDS